MMKFGMWMVLVLLGPLAYAQGFEDAPCSDAASHAEQRECLQTQDRRSDAQLALAEKEALVRIAAWDEDAKYRRQARQSFAAAAASFRHYRASQCAAVGSLAGGGIGGRDRALACSIALSVHRSGQLAQALRDVRPR